MNRYLLWPGVWAITFVASLASVCGDDWPQFRGPGGSGVSTEIGLPVEWNGSRGVVWKADLPGAGSSSPIIVGNKVLVTCFTDPGTIRMARHLICVDRVRGKILWDETLPGRNNEDRWAGFLREHGYTSSTPVSDGQAVYVFYGKAGVLAYDLSGKKMWQADVGQGSDTRGWGSAASPVLYRDKVVVNAGAEGDAIVALNKSSGMIAWRARAPKARGSWCTPVLVDRTDGQQDLVLAVPFEIWGLNPDTGKLRWYATALNSETICSSLVAHDGIVYAIGGRQGGAVAIRAGGSGDVTQTHVLWKSRTGSYVTSPVYWKGHLYWVNDRGVAICLDAEAGETVYERRVEGARSLYASIAAADGKLFAVTRRDGVFVLGAGPQYEMLAHNPPLDGTDFNASPAISGEQLFLRSNSTLYCLGTDHPPSLARGSRR